MANLFLAKGENRLSYKVRKCRGKDFEADAGKSITKLPMVVITNRGHG